MVGLARRALLAASLAALAASAPVPLAGAGDDWVTPGGDLGKSHFSALADVTVANAGQLGFAWEYKLDTDRGLEATPVVIDGVMYTSGVAGRVYALDATTGRPIWTFEPDVDMQITRNVCCDNVNRGVAVRDGRVFVAALDAKLYALDAKTGKIVWQVDTVEDHKRGISSTGAPEIAGDLVLIGNAGAEYDVRGYVSAYDRRTGHLAWRFHVVPRDPKLGLQDHPDLDRAAKTWDPNSRWDIGGGGTPWDAINYDAEFDTVYVGGGNGGPYNARRRSPTGGDNLYLSSLIALDRKSGRVKWLYQETPSDSWDFTATQPMVLTRMRVDGEIRPVIVHSPKNGFLYVFDRRDGKLLRANPLVFQNWTDGIDPKTGRPHLTPERSDYIDAPKIVFPASTGARNWQPMAYDPASGLLYAAVLDMGNLYLTAPGQKPLRSKALNNDAALVFGPDIVAALPTLPPQVRAAVEALPELARVRKAPSTQQLRAIDPLTGATRWAVPMQGWQDRGGVLATGGGLVMQGTLAGDLNVYDAHNGNRLRSIATGTSIMAAPMTYRVRGTQYVAVMAGWGGGGYAYVPHYSAAYTRGNQGRILVFKLGGGPVPIPPLLPPLEVAEAPPPQLRGTTPARLALGQATFFSNCAICHANQHRSLIPDLRRMGAGTHAQFDDIVLGGMLTSAGMPRWNDLLTPDRVEAVHAYLIDLQARTRADELAKQKAGKPLDAPTLTIMSSY